MSVHMDPDVAERCGRACDRFVNLIRLQRIGGRYENLADLSESFDTARQISAVYSVFAGSDLRSLLDGFIAQAEAMSMMFAVGGGLIEAQDEAVAAALGKAAQPPAGMESLGLMSTLNSMTESAAPGASAAAIAGALTGSDAGASDVGRYDRVGPEDVSGTALERIVAAAQALQPAQFAEIKQQVTQTAHTLEEAASSLRRDLLDVLGGQWQGEFARHGAAVTESFTQTAFDLVSTLDQVVDRADTAHAGFDTTRSRIATEAAKLDLTRSLTPGEAAGAGARLGPSGTDSAATAAAAKAAAEEQARAIVNTEYSPAVMSANLDDLHFPTAFRVVSGTTPDGPRTWNVAGTAETAPPAPPTPATLAAVTGGAGTGGTGAVTGAGAGGGVAATDAATEQAVLAARAGAPDGPGPLAASATQTGTSGQPSAGPPGVNAATTPAAAPFAPMTPAHGQTASGPAAGIRGVRAGAGNSRDRGFGSAAGAVGGGGAAAAGAGAARMGGAGSLAGLGGPGGVSGPPVGGPASGPVGAGTAGAAGQMTGSSSSTPTQTGRTGAVPMGGMMGAAGAGQTSDRRGHTPASYLTNATNTTEIIGDPVKVAPAVLGRAPAAPAATESAQSAPTEPSRERVLGREYAGGSSRRP